VPGLHRYDVLFLFAVIVQVLLLAFKIESWRESVVILIFHVVATGMELFKTSDSIGSWKYPEPFSIGIGNVPLFAGFMYSAVGSYIARVWRLMEFRFTQYPSQPAAIGLVVLIYANFFTHHYWFDLRWPLVIGTLLLFGRVFIDFKPADRHLTMPLVSGWFLVALFIWFAENIATWARVWVYPDQQTIWRPVSIDKLVAWYLLMILSFVLVSLVHPPRVRTES